MTKGHGFPLADSPSYDAFRKSPNLCVKVTSYFHVYDRIFAKFRNRDITFVEIGVWEGGSLHMWRSFLGERARIIGIDLNPAAAQLRDQGFEIHIGDQSRPEFWVEFFRLVGEIDVLLDDGGHTFEQQIVTVEHALPFVKDGGLIVVEDTHTSYMREFGGSSSRSFVAYAKNLVDGVNLRFDRIRSGQSELRVHSVQFFESMVVFEIDRPQSLVSSLEFNSGKSAGNEDFRWKANRIQFRIAGVPFRSSVISRYLNKRRLKNLSKYFRYGRRSW